MCWAGGFWVQCCQIQGLGFVLGFPGFCAEVVTVRAFGITVQALGFRVRVAAVKVQGLVFSSGVLSCV